MQALPTMETRKGVTSEIKVDPAASERGRQEIL